MKNNLISVIIPVYNHAFRLKESLRSLAKQTYKDLEVIIVDDGSTDNFDEVFRELKNDSEIAKLNIILIKQNNKGAPAARNNGFEKSKGEYVIFWDADTIGQPEMLEKMIKALILNAGVYYAYSHYKYGWKIIKSRNFNEEALKQINYIDTTSLLRRAAFFPFDESLKRFQDWDLWLTLLENNKTGIFIPEVLYTKQILGRRGISGWLPKFIYRLPIKLRAVKEYEKALAIVQAKHGLGRQVKKPA
ncbi:MAG: glycosyltransferase family A protein [Patescibacteria group bacterium]|jgi:glycosyltransferase involved in cell wall biosynthesis